MAYPYHIKQVQLQQQQQTAMADEAGVYLPTGPGDAQRIALPNCECIPLMTENLFVSVPAAHPLAMRKHVSFADLAGETFLVLDVELQIVRSDFRPIRAD